MLSGNSNLPLGSDQLIVTGVLFLGAVVDATRCRVFFGLLVTARAAGLVNCGVGVGVLLSGGLAAVGAGSCEATLVLEAVAIFFPDVALALAGGVEEAGLASLVPGCSAAEVVSGISMIKPGPFFAGGALDGAVSSSHSSSVLPMSSISTRCMALPDLPVLICVLSPTCAKGRNCFRFLASCSAIRCRVESEGANTERGGQQGHDVNVLLPLHYSRSRPLAYVHTGTAEHPPLTVPLRSSCMLSMCVPSRHNPPDEQRCLRRSRGAAQIANLWESGQFLPCFLILGVKFDDLFVVVGGRVKVA